jgi:hypothetical protein
MKQKGKQTKLERMWDLGVLIRLAVESKIEVPKGWVEEHNKIAVKYEKPQIYLEDEWLGK